MATGGREDSEGSAGNLRASEAFDTQDLREKYAERQYLSLALLLV